MHSSRGMPFTPEELDSLSIWETPGLFNDDGSVNPEQLVEISHPPALTVEEIESMQQQAYDEAFAQGKNEGYAAGYEEGLVAGTESGQQQGFKEGHQQGYTEALEQGRIETHAMQKQHAAQFSSLLDSLNEPFNKLDAKVEKQLVDLSIAIASHLVRRELKLDPGEVVGVVRAAVNVLPVAAQNVILHLHPTDAELVKQSLALTHKITAWTIVENPLITQGGCKVITDVSYVDATVEKRLAAVIAMVLGGEREKDEPTEAVDEDIAEMRANENINEQSEWDNPERVEE